MQVNLFIPCIIDWYYPEIGQKTVFLLEKAGYEVAYDPKQVCCGRYAQLMGCKSMGEQSARDWLEGFRSIKGPLIFPDSACHEFIIKNWKTLEWSLGDQKKLNSVLSNSYELSQFFLEHTKLNTVSSLGRVGVWGHSPIGQILSNAFSIPHHKFNSVAQLSDVTPLFFRNITDSVQKDFLDYLQSSIKVDTFIDTNVVLVKQLQHTAKQIGSTINVLHFTELS